MSAAPQSPSPHRTPDTPAKRFVDQVVRGYHLYGAWLVSLTWRRFIVFSVVLMIAVGVLHNIPPFSWTYTEDVVDEEPHAHASKPAKPAAAPATPKPPSSPAKRDGIDISITESGIHINTRGDVKMPALPASAAHAAASGPASAPPVAAPVPPSGSIRVPADLDTPAVRAAIEAANQGVSQAVEEAKQNMRDAIEEARQEAENAKRDAEEARQDAEEARHEALQMRHFKVRTYGESLPPLTFFFILLSALLKGTYKGRIQAEAKAAQATEVAESESLKRQVIEARMAAMQAQVEPHFLFNTLASIDHLIETDPPRASQMQKNLIALLRASMPTMREASTGTQRELGRELTVVRPYLEILKMRMEDRLQTDIQVPEGLLSAEFPPMMIQSLVENAIKHGLEPKAEGGTLTVQAEVSHGKLAVSVADTGLGFGQAATAGTGVGLANIRERLQMLYGGRAQLTITANQPCGTRVTITVPYVAVVDPNQDNAAA